MLVFPDGGERLRYLEPTECDRIVGGNVELHVVARRKLEFFRRFEHKLFDEGCDVCIAHDAELVWLLCAGSCAAGMRGVDHNLAIALLDRIRGQTATYRGTRRRAIDKVEAPIVLRAFDLLVFHQAVGQMDIPVRAQSVRGVEFTFVVPVNGIGLLAVIKALDVRRSEIGGRTNTDPPTWIGYGGGLVGALIESRLWLRKLTFDVIRRIF